MHLTNNVVSPNAISVNMVSVVFDSGCFSGEEKGRDKGLEHQQQGVRVVMMLHT